MYDTVAVSIISSNYRYNQVGSPTFVIFFMHEPFVVTVDPENVKVKLTPYVNLQVAIQMCT